jgi:hypothetical protein
MLFFTKNFLPSAFIGCFFHFARTGLKNVCLPGGMIIAANWVSKWIEILTH